MSVTSLVKTLRWLPELEIDADAAGRAGMACGAGSLLLLYTPHDPFLHPLCQATWSPLIPVSNKPGSLQPQHLCTCRSLCREVLSCHLPGQSPCPAGLSSTATSPWESSQIALIRSEHLIVDCKKITTSPLNHISQLQAFSSLWQSYDYM